MHFGFYSRSELSKLKITIITHISNIPQTLKEMNTRKCNVPHFACTISDNGRMYRIQDYSCHPTENYIQFRLRPSADPEVEMSRFAGFGVALSERTEVALFS